jgi:hypothetical protein
MSNFNYKVTYTYSQCFPDIDKKKVKIIKENINLAFNSEPSEYEIISKVKDWIDQLKRNVLNDTRVEIEFKELVKFKKLKVVKGIANTDLSDLKGMSDWRNSEY